jgi:hypothetical protein
MSHFAHITGGVVDNVIVIDAETLASGRWGDPASWVQTSYNTNQNQHPEGRPLRGNYAGIGYTYDAGNDVFYGAKPAPSCTLNTSTWSWEYPIPYPTEGGTHVWSEDTQSWVKI